MFEITDVDLEVQEILQNRDLDALPVSSNLPGSPVLNSIKSDRKALLGRRRAFKNRSRVRTNLSDQFESSLSQENSSQNNNEETASPSITDNQIICNENFDEGIMRKVHVEGNNTKENYSDNLDDSCFKRPLSPSCCPIVSPKFKLRKTFNNSQLENIENKTPQSNSNNILTFQSVPVNSASCLNSSSKKFKNTTCLNTSFSTASAFLSSVRYSAHVGPKMGLKQSKNICNTESEHLSLTQEIFDSGITNSQILSAFDNVFENTKDKIKDFPGFNNDEITNSEQMYNNFIECVNVTADKSSLKLAKIPKIQSNNKHKLETLFLPPCKRVKGNLEELDWKNREFGNKNIVYGFSTASGSKINTPSTSLDKTRSLFSHLNIPMAPTLNTDISVSKFPFVPFKGQRVQKNCENVALQENNVNKIFTKNQDHHQTLRKLTKNKLEFFDDLLKGFENENISDVGFNITPLQASSLDQLEFNEHVHKGSNSFNVPIPPKQETNASHRPVPCQNVSPFYKKVPLTDQGNSSLKKVSNQEISKNKLNFFDDLIGDNSTGSSNTYTGNSNFSGFSKPLTKIGTFQSNNNLPLMSSAGNNLIPRILQKEKSGPLMGFSTASGRSVQVSQSSLKKASDIFKTIDEEFTVTKQSSFGGSLNKNSFKTPLKETNNLAPKKRKRFGGILACKQIKISDEKLKKASLFFNEDLSSISPIRPFQINSGFDKPQFHSTPLKINNFSTPNRGVFGNFCNFAEGTITPIRPESNSQDTLQTFKESIIEDFVIEDTNVIITSPTKVEGLDLIEELEQEKKRLEERLKVIQERQAMLNVMKEESSKVDGRPRRGVLFRRKTLIKKTSLRNFVENLRPGQEYQNSMLIYITPENAGNLHFKESSTSIRTTDGAVIIPNKEDRVGITEISQAFKNMPGVEVRLIPNGWTENHFKWIVWKLASYERLFPKKFDGALTIENVVQQLKYRYDREIDRAERPALRRIFEKDDAPQKRLVLCISDIKQTGNGKYELELTDGWYSIRTVLDEPLCNEVMNCKLKIGTKLITCDAEIVNCDGCYPLEASDLIYLKISYNSTRRARWYTKLGYQPVPGPFPVKIRTIHELGGVIGIVNICIVRCYPLKFLEKHDNYSVWRNEKAEKRRAQEWDNVESMKLEQIHEEIRSRLSQCYNTSSRNARSKKNVTDISSVTCPEQLLEILENSNDPEGFEAQLSSSQKQSLIEYKRDLFLKTQQEILVQFNDDFEKLSKQKRTVSCSLKLLVVDLNDNPNRFFNFFVWHPTETHQDMMTEGSCLSVHNALPRKNCDMASGNRTVFKPCDKTTEMSIIFRRKISEIGDINELKFPSDFREFDTVGVVVDTRIESTYQEVWLTNPSGRLLVIKIFEGPNTCSLLDSLKRGKPTSACNLVYHSLRDDVVHATGNHFTIFSCYSQYKHMEVGLERLKNCVPKNLDYLLEDCDKKIHAYRGIKSNYTSTNSTNSSKVSFESEEDTLVSSQLSKTDIALSMIDVDKLN